MCKEIICILSNLRSCRGDGDTINNEQEQQL